MTVSGTGSSSIDMDAILERLSAKLDKPAAKKAAPASTSSIHKISYEEYKKSLADLHSVSIHKAKPSKEAETTTAAESAPAPEATKAAAPSAPPKELTKEQQKNAAASGGFTTSKDSLKVFQQGKTDADSDLTAQLQQDNLLTDQGIDAEAAKGKFKELKEQTKGNINSQGIDNILAASQIPAAEGSQPAKITQDTYKQFGIDEGFFGGISSKGEAQLAALKSKNIVKEDGTIAQNLNDEQKKYLTDQKAANTHRDNIGKVADGDVDVFAKQTSDATDGDSYAKTEVDKKGNVKGFEKNAKTIQQAHTESAIAKQQLQMGGLSPEVMKDITTVNKNGDVELDLSKLSAEDYQKLVGSKNGIQYDGAGALTLKDETGGNIKVNITGGATQVNLKGKTTADISTQNKSLQVNADKESEITGVSGQNLKQLGINGGKLKDDLASNPALQSLDLQNTELENGLNINKADSNLSLKMKDSTVSQGQNTNIIAKHLTMDISGGSTGNINVQAQKVAAKLEGTTAGNIDAKAEEEAQIVCSNGTNAGEIAVAAKKLAIASFSDNSKAKKTDLSHSGKAELSVEDGSTTGELAINKDKTEIVGDNERAVKDLEAATGIKGKLHSDSSSSKTAMADKDFQKIFGFRYENDDPLRKKDKSGRLEIQG